MRSVMITPLRRGFNLNLSHATRQLGQARGPRWDGTLFTQHGTYCCFRFSAGRISETPAQKCATWQPSLENEREISHRHWLGRVYGVLWMMREETGEAQKKSCQAVIEWQNWGGEQQSKRENQHRWCFAIQNCKLDGGISFLLTSCTEASHWISSPRSFFLKNDRKQRGK